VVVLTLAVFSTGIALLLGPVSWRARMLLLHKASFIVWLGVMTLHVLGHLLDTTRLAPRDWLRHTRRQVDGAGARQWTVAASLALGLIVGVIVTPHVGSWLVAGAQGRL
jgi:cytochrome c biogenesis protein CcdA